MIVFCLTSTYVQKRVSRNLQPDFETDHKQQQFIKQTKNTRTNEIARVLL